MPRYVTTELTSVVLVVLLNGTKPGDVLTVDNKTFFTTLPEPPKCAAYQLSTGDHCPEKPVYRVGLNEYVCDKCYERFLKRVEETVQKIFNAKEI